MKFCPQPEGAWPQSLPQPSPWRDGSPSPHLCGSPTRPMAKNPEQLEKLRSSTHAVWATRLVVTYHRAKKTHSGRAGRQQLRAQTRPPPGGPSLGPKIQPDTREQPLRGEEVFKSQRTRTTRASRSRHALEVGPGTTGWPPRDPITAEGVSCTQLSS